MEQDSLQRLQDSLNVLTNELAMENSAKDSLHNVLDDMLFGAPPVSDVSSDSISSEAEMEEEAVPTREALPVEPHEVISLNDISRYIKQLEAQRKNKKKETSGGASPFNVALPLDEQTAPEDGH